MLHCTRTLIVGQLLLKGTVLAVLCSCPTSLGRALLMVLVRFYPKKFNDLAHCLTVEQSGRVYNYIS